MDLLLPYAQIENFLPQPELDALLEWVLASEGRFRPATIKTDGDDQVLDPKKRVALTMRELGPAGPKLNERILQALPELMRLTGASGPEPTRLEIELAAHGDGAHYLPHTDIPIGDIRKHRSGDDDRVLSAVLYFHAEPKAFSGGQLRLFRLGAAPGPAQPGDFVDLEPLQNSLAVFHSWVKHEVRPVRVPSNAFANFRFAANIWLRRKLPD